MDCRTSRRNVLKGLTGAAVLTALGGVRAAQLVATPDLGDALKLPMPMTTLGRKKLPISRLAVGGWHQGVEMSEDDAIAMMHRALELGVTFFDSAYSYGNSGESEKRLGKAFAARRDKVVLMSKSTQRDASGAERELEESLKRLQTDHLDIWQFHAITHMEEAEKTAGAGGAVEVARKALADGRIRTLGATGHAVPEALNRMLELVPEIEAAQFPVNCVDRHWKSFIETTIPFARERGLSILAMKTLAKGTLTSVKDITITEAHRYMLSQPITAWISGITSIKQLEENVALVKSFTPMSAEEQSELLARSIAYKGARYEDYKTWGV